MSILELQKKVYNIALKRGQWKDKNIDNAIMDLVEESIELRNSTKRANLGIFEDLLESGKSYKEAFNFAIKDTVDEEGVDLVITALSICEHLRIDVDTMIAIKNEYNRIR